MGSHGNTSFSIAYDKYEIIPAEPGEHYLPTGMISRAPGAIEPQQLIVVRTRLFVSPP